MRSFTWSRFTFEHLPRDSSLVSSVLWWVVIWIQICASLNHRKKMKAEPNLLIPRKL